MRQKKTIGRTAGMLFPWLLAVYFGYFLWEGNYGVRAYIAQKRAAEEQQAQLNMLKGERQRQQHRVATLREENVAKDPDMLAEQAQQVLGFGLPEEYIVPNDRYTTFTVPAPSR
jgi:cell division protein FtsB